MPAVRDRDDTHATHEATRSANRSAARPSHHDDHVATSSSAADSRQLRPAPVREAVLDHDRPAACRESGGSGPLFFVRSCLGNHDGGLPSGRDLGQAVLAGVRHHDIGVVHQAHAGRRAIGHDVPGPSTPSPTDCCRAPARSARRCRSSPPAPVMRSTRRGPGRREASERDRIARDGADGLHPIAERVGQSGKHAGCGCRPHRDQVSRDVEAEQVCRVSTLAGKNDGDHGYAVQSGQQG